MSVNVLSTKVLIEDMIFTSPPSGYWRWDRHLMWSSEPRKGLAVCRAKYAASSFSVILRPLVLALGIEHGLRSSA